jgi:hypothetical protein
LSARLRLDLRWLDRDVNRVLGIGRRQLGLYGQNTTEYGSAEADGTEVEGGGRVGIPGVATVGAKGKASSESARTKRRSVSRHRPMVNLVSEELREHKIPIIIDDFHYLPAKVQLEIGFWSEQELADAGHSRAERRGRGLGLSSG